VSEKRLSLWRNGQVRYELKTPYREGTTHVNFEPMDFIARLGALVPKPRFNLTRFHGVFAPDSAHRAQVTPAKRGKVRTADSPEDTRPAERPAALTWAQRLTRVFNLDIETCNSCGGHVKIIACIEAPVVIEKTLTQLASRAAGDAARGLPRSRAPPWGACSPDRGRGAITRVRAVVVTRTRGRLAIASSVEVAEKSRGRTEFVSAQVLPGSLRRKFPATRGAIWAKPASERVCDALTTWRYSVQLKKTTLMLLILPAARPAGPPPMTAAGRHRAAPRSGPVRQRTGRPLFR